MYVYQVLTITKPDVYETPCCICDHMISHYTHRMLDELMATHEAVTTAQADKLKVTNHTI